MTGTTTVSLQVKKALLVVIATIFPPKGTLNSVIAPSGQNKIAFFSFFFFF